MHNCKTETSNANHGTFQDHEADLIVCQGPMKTSRELGYPKYGLNKYSDGCNTEPCKEGAKQDAFGKTAIERLAR